MASHFSNYSTKWKKAKPGITHVMDTLTSKSVLKPQLYLFLGLTDRPIPSGVQYWNTAGVELKNLETGEAVVVNGDDRYGHYPIMDQSRIGDMLSRREDLEEELGKYTYILNLIAKHTDADL